MKKTLLILASLLLFAGVILGILFLWSRVSPETAPIDATFFPDGGAPTSDAYVPTKVVLTTFEGTTISVNDVTEIEGVETDPNQPGYYYIAGGISPDEYAAAYQIFYAEADDYFGITLYKTPFGTSRKDAEEFLQASLGIDAATMCHLNYVVAVAPGLSEVNAGQNLGFSFCPGAITLQN